MQAFKRQKTTLAQNTRHADTQPILNSGTTEGHLKKNPIPTVIELSKTHFPA